MAQAHRPTPTSRVPRLRARRSPCLAKLDALRWEAGLAFRAYGARVGVRTTDADALPQVERALPTGAVRTQDETVDHLVSFVVGGETPAARLRRFDLLYAGAHRFLRTLDRDEAMRVLANHLELAVAEMAPGRLFVHAGVVGWKGRAILVPGASHSGKTRLIAALLARGAVYCSDEYAVLDRWGRVHPYPRPLVLRRRDDAGPRVSAADLGARTARQPLPVGLIAVTRYESDGRWRPRPLSPARAVLELAANSVSVRKRPEQTLATLACVAEKAPAVAGARGEAKETAGWLIEMLESRLV